MSSKVEVKKIAYVGYFAALEKDSGNETITAIDHLERIEISGKPWPKFFTLCSATFSIAHTGSSILLKYFIRNDFFASKERLVNSDVNKDNCVEFFIGFSNDAYYNIEFNCLGIGKVAYGKSRVDRELLPVEIVKTIGASINLSSKNERFDWEILLIIPKEVFYHQKIDSFKGLTCKGNFYKCGDDLPKQDFLVWNHITGNEPDFHRPDCFGTIIFDAV